MANSEAWQVYLLKCADNSLYCGITNNIDRRLAQHNGLFPGGARYTRGRRPVVLLGLLHCESKSCALGFECAVKGMNRKKKLRFFKVDENAGS